MGAVAAQYGDVGVGPSVLARIAQQVRQFLCGLHGHDALLHFEAQRMSMQCTSCGFETPGWDLKPEPRRVVQLPLGCQRRVW